MNRTRIDGIGRRPLSALVIGAMVVAGGCGSMMEAASRGDYRRIEDLHQRGEDINQVDAQGRTPLHLAAMNGHDKTASALISMGARIDATDALGDTPLHLAAAGNHDATVRTLLASGASTSIKNQAGQTARDVAHSRIKAILPP